MTQPPAEGHDQGAEPGRGTPPGRDPRPTGFGSGGAWHARPPSAALAAAAEAVSGPGWACPGATNDELDGLLERWAAIESWASAGKLGVVREKIRRAECPRPRGGVQSTAIESLTHEVALALAVSVQTADKTGWLALQLGERLPGIGELLANGTLTQSKAAALAAELSVLTDLDAARAEALILGQLAGKTYGQLTRLAARAACEVDPAGAQKRREAAERDDARVRQWREQSGTAAIAGTGLPSDEALAAFANVGARATDYKDSGAFPDARMDQLRAMAYLDLLNGVTPAARITRAIARARAGADARAEADARAAADPDAAPDADANPGTDTSVNADAVPGTDADASSHAGTSHPGTSHPAATGAGEDDRDVNAGHRDLGADVPEDGDAGDGDGDLGPGGPDDSDGPSSPAGPGGGQPGGPSPSPSPAPDPEPGPGSARPPALQDLIIPLRTLLGLAARPGEGHNLGPLDPGLARDLAAAAALSPRSEWCVTIVDTGGIAIGHGCARAVEGNRVKRPPDPSAPPLAGFPARVNLTIPLPALVMRSALRVPSAPRGSPGSPGSTARAGSSWTFTPRDDPGLPGGYGSWTLALPGGRELTVRLDPVPVFGCDHRNQSHAYQPNDTLRHLVQVRDGTCTFPSCSRHARESDFEHAVPYDQGGRTCACNAGARSRRCHRVKQSPGWKLTQPRPGWHQWTTPSGRTYTQGPMRYPS